jgi:hypothetical protein
MSQTQNNMSSNNNMMQNTTVGAAAANAVSMQQHQQHQQHQHQHQHHQQQQQQQMPMMWKAPGTFQPSFQPNPVMTPIAPESAPNITLAHHQEMKMLASASKSKVGNNKAAVTCSSNESVGDDLADDLDNDRTEKNRERNREHARCTRLRKKAYIQKLKDMAHGLRAVQTKDIRERRVSMHNLLNIKKDRRSVVQTVLNYHASYEKDTMKWGALLEDSFWMKEPVTPFRSFRRAEVETVSGNVLFC